MKKLNPAKLIVTPAEVLASCVLLMRHIVRQETFEISAVETEILIAMNSVFLHWMSDSFLVLHKLANEQWTLQSFDAMVRPEGIESNFAEKFNVHPSLLAAFDIAREGYFATSQEMGRRAASQDLAKHFVLDNRTALLKKILPVRGYYQIPSDTGEDRKDRALEGFDSFLKKLQESVTVAKWTDFPRFIPVKDFQTSPEEQIRVTKHLQASIDRNIIVYHPLLSGGLENAPLAVRTHFRDVYKHLGAGEAKQALFELEQEGKTREEAFNPEAILGIKLARDQAGELAKEMRMDDSALCWAITKSTTKAGKVNKTKAARELQISRPTFNKRYEKFRQKYLKQYKHLAK